MFAIALDEDAELRPLEPWQAEEFLTHMDRAREVVDPWIPWASRNADLDSCRATLQRYADQTARDAARIYGIWLNGTLVGGTMFVSFDATAGTCEVGCWLEPAGQGRGLITKSAEHLINWAVHTRGIHRVEWITRPDNTASSNVARRLGMHLDGTLRENSLHHGTRHSSEVWSILAPEWGTRTATPSNATSSGAHPQRPPETKLV